MDKKIIIALGVIVALLLFVGLPLYVLAAKKKAEAATTVSDSPATTDTSSSSAPAESGTSGTSTSSGVVNTIINNAASLIKSLDTRACTGPELTKYSFIGNQLTPDGALAPCQGLKSVNGNYVLVQQSDGNLVVYDVNRKDWLWALNSATNGNNNFGARAPNYTVFQRSGDLTTFNRDDGKVWASAQGQPSTNLSLQDDGNLILYNGDIGNIVWKANIRAL